MGFNQLFDNGEAEARPAMLPGSRFLTTVETFEDEGKICCGDSFAGVGESQLDLSGYAFGGDPNGSAGRGILPGVLKEVTEDLGQLLRIRLNAACRAGELCYNAEPLHRELWLEAIQSLRHQLLK